MVLPSGALMKVQPTTRLKKQAEQLKLAMLIEAMILFPLILFGSFSIFLQLLTIGLGWYAIWDPNAYKPTIMQIFFLITVFGSVLTCVDLALSVSALIETGVYWNFIGIGLWSAASTILIIVAHLSWTMFKEMLTAPPPLPISSTPLNIQYSRTRDNEHSYSAVSTGTGTFNILGSGDSHEKSSSKEFAPFQGQGRKLGC